MILKPGCFPKENYKKVVYGVYPRKNLLVVNGFKRFILSDVKKYYPEIYSWIMKG
jgi:hypothetical protein